jgi:uncharacterized protein (DUF2236 family)
MSIRHAVGLTQDPPPRCNDRAVAYFPVDGIARIVHGDLSSMMVGGLGSLFFQMLHPYAMAGVAQHSRYQHDPLGRLLQTANFIGYTTYGSKPTAYAAIEKVLAVHQGVRGIADDGQPYEANDPHLLAWVHAAETSMFLAGYQRFGRHKLTRADVDTYVSEMAVLARDLGVETPPTTLAELNETLQNFRSELRLSADGVIARDFVLNGFVEGAVQKAAYRLLVASALDLLTPWARELLDTAPRSPLRRKTLRVATHLMCKVLRAFVPPTKPVSLNN